MVLQSVDLSSLLLNTSRMKSNSINFGNGFLLDTDLIFAL